MVVAVGLVVGDEARVAVAPKSEVAVAVGPFLPPLSPAARAVWVAIVLNTELSGSSVAVGSEAPVIERVQAASRRPAQAKAIKLSWFRMGTQNIYSRSGAILAYRKFNVKQSGE